MPTVSVGMPPPISVFDHKKKSMNLLNSILRAGKIAVFALAGWLLSSSILFAKEGETPGGGGGQGSWVMSYGLVLMLIVLAMITVCRASTRRDRVRPEAYAEGKVGHSADDDD
jgi:hypothetical protein